MKFYKFEAQTTNKMYKIKPIEFFNNIVYKRLDFLLGFVKKNNQKSYKDYVNQLIDELEARGATVYVSRRSRAQNILTALNTLKLRRMVIESDRLFKTDPESHDLLSYYANSIAHWRTP